MKLPFTYVYSAVAMLAITIFPVLTGLSGCAVSPEINRADEFIDGNVMQYVQRFDLTARISIHVAEKIDSAKIAWSRSPPNETVKFFTPFGSQIAEVVADHDGARLQRAGAANTVASAATVADLMAMAIDVRLDTAALARWVQGFDLKTTVDMSGFPDGGGAKLWTVKAENFRLIDGARVASRITAISGDTVVRVVIDEFRAH